MAVFAAQEAYANGVYLAAMAACPPPVTPACAIPIHAAYIAALDAAILQFEIEIVAIAAYTASWVYYYEVIVESKMVALKANWLIDAWNCNPPLGILPHPTYVFGTEDHPPEYTAGFLDD